MPNNKTTRRNFIKKTTLVTFSAALGTNMVYGDIFPKGLIPIALENLPEKHSGLTILNDRPINAETPPHLLAVSYTHLTLPTNRKV